MGGLAHQDQDHEHEREREHSCDREREGLRQQLLLCALLGDEDAPAMRAEWLRPMAAAGDQATLDRGLAAYRANAGALAERALAAAFPTLQQLIGEDSFAALARDFWRRQPPVAGDMAQWGERLPDFVGTALSLAGEPYLADVARVDWAVHSAERAADTGPVHGLDLLAALDPSELQLQLIAGTAIVPSAYPVAAIWQAHRPSAGGDDDRYTAVREAFAAGRGETALVFRHGWSPRVLAVSAAETAFTQAVLAAQTLQAALLQAGPQFDFEAWLIAALQQQRLQAVLPLAQPEGGR